MKLKENQEPGHSLCCPRCRQWRPTWQYTRLPFDPEQSSYLPVYQCPDQKCLFLFAPYPEAIGRVVLDFQREIELRQRQYDQGIAEAVRVLTYIGEHAEQPDEIVAYLKRRREGAIE